MPYAFARISKSGWNEKFVGHVAALAVVFLELAHHAQRGIVYDDDLNAEALLHHRAKLLHGHLDAAVPGHQNDFAAGSAQGMRR